MFIPELLQLSLGIKWKRWHQTLWPSLLFPIVERPPSFLEHDLVHKHCVVQPTLIVLLCPPPFLFFSWGHQFHHREGTNYLTKTYCYGIFLFREQKTSLKWAFVSQNGVEDFDMKWHFWGSPYGNPWNGVQVCFLDLFKQDHSSQHFKSPYPACSASAEGRLPLLVRHLLGLREPVALRAVFMELHLLLILCAYSFCCCQKEQKHLWNWKYPRNQFWGRAFLSLSFHIRMPWEKNRRNTQYEFTKSLSWKYLFSM